jgi:hypothetical protein
MMPSDLLLALAGFMLPLALVSRIGHWVMALRDLRRNHASASTLAVATLSNSAPWICALVVLGAYRFRDDIRAMPILVGAAGGLLMILWAARKRAPPQVEWKPGVLLDVDPGLRRILWFGRHKHVYVTWYAFGCALSMVAVFEYGSDWDAPFVADVFYFTFGYLCGVGMGHFFWHVAVWPFYAAFPGNIDSPPGERFYKDVPELKPLDEYPPSLRYVKAPAASSSPDRSPPARRAGSSP